jgi:antitoxin component YwqK of YwqJK toxin-antitoxin module
MAKAKPVKHTEFHKDGTLRAQGQMVDGVLAGYWEWFRKDGTMLRSGTFDAGRQVGKWTTYDSKGRAYKVTDMDARATKSQPKRP